MKPWDLLFDIESNNLLNSESIDYSVVPYKLRDSFKLHCIVVDLIVDGKNYLYAFYDGDKYVLDGRAYEETIEGNTYKLEAGYPAQDYIHKQLSEFKPFIQTIPVNSVVRGHNIINFDLLALKLYYGIPYTVEEDMSLPLGDDTWAGKPVQFDDTLVRAKTLNPDRFGGNSLEALASKGNVQKVSFRTYLPKEQRFKHFAADMLYYNIFDCKSNRAVVDMLDKEQQQFEWGDKWNNAIKLEKATVELITRQEHRGFSFNKGLATECLEELDALMEERKAKIEPILPRKPATKGYLSDFIPPKKQFLGNGKPNSFILKFAAKHGGSVEEEGGVWKLKAFGKVFDLPVAQVPLCEPTVPASIGDTTHIKDWLVGLGWQPLEYKEKDITVNTKKLRLPADKQQAAIERYIEQTMTTSFMFDRCEHLLGIGNVSRKSNPAVLRSRLETYFNKRLQQGRGIKVLTNPSFTVGQEKEICSNLIAFAESNPQYACILDIVEYLTYRHRRNSILGGGVTFEDFDNEDEDEQTVKGFLANVREDGRIPTPADTCGAATSRFKHRLVANVPRCTSLYGPKMRALFGVDDTCYQVGYDFDSLEAREEANFCWPYEDGDVKEYCESLLQDKPNDVHTKMAQKISVIIAKEFARGPAKSVKYGATYGAQGPKLAKTIGCDLETGNMIFEAFWEAAAPLKQLKDALAKEWADFNKQRIIGIDGRLVPTRAAHAILNSKFQSSGVICAKRAMVIHDRKLKNEGLLVDFFTENLDGRDYCQQLIAYHDESQLEANKQSVKFKMFATEEEAQSFKDASDKLWSDIKPSPKGGFYVAYCRAGELAVEAVSQSGKDYGMVIELTAGYIVGRNWAECH